MDTIQQAMEIHQLIFEAASTANKYFTYQLLTIISISFLIILFDAYYVLETVMGKSELQGGLKATEFIVFFSCQMFLYLIAIMSIVEGGNHAIRKVGTSTHLLLFSLNCYSKSQFQFYSHENRAKRWPLLFIRY